MEKKKVIFLLLSALLVLALPGCGRKAKEAAASKDYVYRYEELSEDEELQELYSMFLAGGTPYLYGVKWAEGAANGKLIIAQLDEEGGVVRTAKIEQPGNINYNFLTGNAAGDIFCIKTVYNEGNTSPQEVMPMQDASLNGAFVTEATATAGDAADDKEATAGDAADDGETAAGDAAHDEEAVADTAENQKRALDVGAVTKEEEAAAYTPEQYFLVQLDMNGEEKWSVRLNDIKELNDQDYFYVNALVSLPGQKLLLSAMEKYAIFDMTGNYQGLFKLSGPGTEDQQGNQRNMLVLADDRVISYRYVDKGLSFQELDPQTGVLGAEHILEGGNIYSFSVYPGAGFDLFLADYSDLYGYNIGQERVKLMNYVDSDLNISGFSSLWARDQSVFLSFLYDDALQKNYLARFTKVPPEDVPDKITMTLAGSYIDWEVKRQIVQFNKSNEKYRIRILDYGTTYNTQEDYGAGITKLNTDIASGNIPDILLITSDLPVKSYMVKGLFADLLPFLEKDAELDPADLLPNVVKAYSVDGHLYQLVPSFTIMTAFAKTADVGSEPGWTIKNAMEIVAGKPEGTRLLEDVVRSTLFYYSMSMGGEQFVDWEKGECHYDSRAFMDLLEFIKTYPEEIDYSQYKETDWADRESQWRTGKVLVQLGSIYSLREYNRTVKAVFGEPVTMIGFPAESGIGSSVNTYLSFAMSAKSKHQEGAWELLRYFLTDEYQSKMTYTLPVSKKALDKIGEEAMRKQSYEDETGKRIETDETYYVGGKEIVLEPIGAEELEKVKNFIDTVETTSDYNEDLLNIITEEAAPFFAGQKSVEEVADIIQSRAKIYVSENG